MINKERSWAFCGKKKKKDSCKAVPTRERIVRGRKGSVHAVGGPWLNYSLKKNFIECLLRTYESTQTLDPRIT